MKIINKLIKLLILLIGFVSSSNYCYSNLKTEYTISARIKGLPDKVRFCLIKGDRHDISDTVQSTISKDGIFQFKSENLDIGRIYFIIIDTTTFKLSGLERNWIRVVLDSTTIEIFGDMERWPNLNNNGTSLKVYDDYHEVNTKYISEMNSLRKLLIQKAPDSIKLKVSLNIEAFVKADTSTVARKYVKERQSWKEFIKDYVNQNANSVVMPLLIMKSNVLNLDDKNQILNILTEKAKNSFYGKQLKEYLVLEIIRNTIVLGKQMPDFLTTTPEGKNVSIKKMIEENKLTLIDFWASWCKPCRESIPYLKEIYREYNSKGFNIIGVVTAKNDKEATWKNALAADKTPWNQVMDMTNTSDVFFPKIAIPGYVLVDGSGKIIATALVDGGKGLGTQGPKITGEDLIKTVADQLKNRP